MTPDVNLNSRPHLAPGCSTAQANNRRILQMPGRNLPLSGPSFEIVSRCDGKHTVQQIISQLQSIYSKAEPQKIAQDILGYLALLHRQGALEFRT